MSDFRKLQTALATATVVNTFTISKAELSRFAESTTKNGHPCYRLNGDGKPVFGEPSRVINEMSNGFFRFGTL